MHTQATLCPHGKRERENAQRAKGQNAQISANGKSVRKREMGRKTGNGFRCLYVACLELL